MLYRFLSISIFSAFCISQVSASTIERHEVEKQISSPRPLGEIREDLLRDEIKDKDAKIETQRREIEELKRQMAEVLENSLQEETGVNNQDLYEKAAKYEEISIEKFNSFFSPYSYILERNIKKALSPEEVVQFWRAANASEKDELSVPKEAFTIVLTDTLEEFKTELQLQGNRIVERHFRGCHLVCVSSRLKFHPTFKKQSKLV